LSTEGTKIQLHVFMSRHFVSTNH